ncbi:MAG: hypothetical protein E6Q92_10665 [Burkholderiaceae bacterium]|nr:MAG: hypothetical protein E6Q92_10665 [Burkholderiaceae bacterium]
MKSVEEFKVHQEEIARLTEQLGKRRAEAAHHANMIREVDNWIQGYGRLSPEELTLSGRAEEVAAKREELKRLREELLVAKASIETLTHQLATLEAESPSAEILLKVRSSELETVRQTLLELEVAMADLETEQARTQTALSEVAAQCVHAALGQEKALTLDAIMDAAATAAASERRRSELSTLLQNIEKALSNLNSRKIELQRAVDGAEKALWVAKADVLLESMKRAAWFPDFKQQLKQAFVAGMAAGTIFDFRLFIPRILGSENILQPYSADDIRAVRASLAAELGLPVKE